jgi:hypothetical protein
MAVLDERNHVNTFPTWGPKGRMMLGYLVLDGTFSFVADVQSELHVSDDHLGLNGARARITDRLGRAIEIQGRTVGEYNVQPYGQGYFCTHGPMVFECQHRAWRGMVEWSAMRFIPPWHRDALGLSKDNDCSGGTDSNVGRPACCPHPTIEPSAPTCSMRNRFTGS